MSRRDNNWKYLSMAFTALFLLDAISPKDPKHIDKLEAAIPALEWLSHKDEKEFWLRIPPQEIREAPFGDLDYEQFNFLEDLLTKHNLTFMTFAKGLRHKDAKLRPFLRALNSYSLHKCNDPGGCF